MVDTRMQALIRQQGPPAMPPADVETYRRAHRDGQLLPPEVPASAIAWLARFAPAEWSGAYLSHDDPRITVAAADVFAQALAPRSS